MRRVTRERRRAAIIAALRIGVENVAHSLARYRRLAALNHRLTDSDKAELREAAIEEAKALLKPQGIDLFTYFDGPALRTTTRHMVDETAERASWAQTVDLPAEGGGGPR